jgi:CDP-diacylglycerol--serine O-phosphatidyltransferase
VNLRRTYFILPNLFTLACVFSGFASICISSGAHTARDLYDASLFICMGFLFDTLDGRVARLTKTQSALGLQLDSLADVMTFGAAPALLVYKWGLDSFGRWGVFIAFLYVAAGALRLARFNVLSMAAGDGHSKPGKFMLGLPIPAAAAVLLSLVVVNFKVGGNFAIAQPSVAVVVVVLSYLMVSRVRFRSFKDLRLTRKTVAVTAMLVIASLVIALKLRPSFIFVFLMSVYLSLALSEELVFFRRRRREDAELRSSQARMSAAAEEAKEDKEVLRDLGAFDEDDGTPRPAA